MSRQEELTMTNRKSLSLLTPLGGGVEQFDDIGKNALSAVELGSERTVAEPDGGAEERIRACERLVYAALGDVFSQIAKVDADLTQRAVPKLAVLTPDGSYDPLTYVELIALGYGMSEQDGGKNITHADLLDYSFRHHEKPFASSVIYRAFEKLGQRGLIKSAGTSQSPRTGRPAEYFIVQPSGREAFWIALAGHVLLESRRRKAA
jgi:hypothetical protein